MILSADGVSLADISFLLPFLRVRYFSQLEALKLLDNYITRRTKFAKWFRNLDPADPKILDVYDRGYVCTQGASKQDCSYLSLRIILMHFDTSSNVNNSVLFGSRPSDHYFRSVCWFVCLSVCLFVCLCRVFLSRL